MTKRIEIEKVDEARACSECGSAQLARDDGRGELVCQQCGLVLEQGLIDQGPEWRAFDAEQREKRARTGAPMTLTLHDKGLSTEIGWNNKDSQGKSIPAANRAQLYRIRRWHRRIRASTALERNLVFALGELDRMASRMGLARNVRETAAMVYRRAVQANLIRGRSIEGVAAASLYAACRQSGIPRTLDEIAEASRVSRKEVGRTFRFVARELKLKLPPTGPESYLARFCSELRLSGAIRAQAEALLRQASALGLTNGKGPMGIAAATVYIASILGNDRRTQEEVAQVSGVTEVTIRNRYKELAQRLEMPSRGLPATEGPSPAKVPLERVLHPLLGELHRNPAPRRVTEEERLAEEFVRRPGPPPQREVAAPA